MGTIRLTDRGGGVFGVTIDRPEARNAFDDALIADWVARLGELAGLAPRAVVVEGEGEIFSAGYDITGIDPEQDPSLPLPDDRLERIIHAVDELPCPIVAALHGDAFGGGLDLALACDLRVAAKGIRLAMTPCRLGLVYSPSGIARFVAALGAPLARKLFLTAAPISAEEAAARGIVELAGSGEDARREAFSLAKRIAANAPIAVRGARRTIRELSRAAERGLDGETRALLAELRAAAFASSDLREGLAAFREKRPPRFRGE